MSYMKSGHAQKWTTRIFHWEQEPENFRANKFFDWENFCSEFKKEFTPAHSDALAINRLELAAYYQKNRPLDDYIDKFQDLVAKSGYSDLKTIVAKFHRGLSPQIQNAVATMSSGRPSDTNPDEWYSMARTVDQNRAANEAFTATHQPAAPTSHPFGTSLICPAPPPSKTSHAHIVLTPGNPVPMDLNAAKKRVMELLCYRCNLPGHFRKSCPMRFDIQMMSMDELQEALEDRTVLLDVAPLDSPRLLEVSPEITEDFPQDDK